MGVDYLYCGECRECYHEDDFPKCNRESCFDDWFEHSSGHGYYCIDCGLKEKVFIEIDEMYFCNKKCHRIYEKEREKEEAEYLIERELNISKCSYCLKEQPIYKFMVLSGADGYLCNDDCSRKLRLKTNIPKFIEMRPRNNPPI